MVDRIETTVVGLPLPRPVRTPWHRIATLYNVITTLQADGLAGTGYAWTFEAREAAAIAALVDDLAPVVCNESIWPVALLHDRLRSRLAPAGEMGPGMFAVAAVDAALWDLRARAARVPLYRLLGGERRPSRVYASTFFQSDPLEQMLHDAEEAVSSGFRALKVRVGGPDERTDLSRVAAVRKAVGPDVQLFVDAVWGWTPDQALRMAFRLAELDVRWFEDPVPSFDRAGLARVAAQAPIPIVAGENEFAPRGIATLMDAVPLSIMMLDLQHLGGITAWCRAAAVVHAAARPITAHTFVEMSLHLLALEKEPPWAEVVPWWQPLCGPVVQVRDGLVWPSDGAGNGIVVDPDLVQRYRVT